MISEKQKGLYKLEAPEPKPKHNPQELFDRFTQLAAAQPEGYVIDDSNAIVIEALCYYFSNVPYGKFNLSKGIFLAGNTGSGKTTLMRIFSQIVPFTFYYVDNICDNVRREGQEQLDKIKQRTYDELCFDDFGSEAKIMHYGSNYDVMYDVVVRRCQDFVHHKTKTHFTTNMTMQDIIKIYDTRIESRLHEMCNIVILGGKLDYKDWRKKII